MPLELVVAVLERSELSIQELLKIGTLCSTFRHAIEQSMALRERMFIRESARTVDLNTDVMPLVGPSVYVKSDDKAIPHGLEGWALARNLAKPEDTVDATPFVMILIFHK